MAPPGFHRQQRQRRFRLSGLIGRPPSGSIPASPPRSRRADSWGAFDHGSYGGRKPAYPELGCASMMSSRPARPRRLLGRSLCVVVGMAFVAACGGSSTPKSSSTSAATTTSAPAVSTSTSPSSTAASSSSPGTNVWDADARQYRGRNGEKFTINCTPPGKVSSIWGVETYTDDSSICNVAVQVGLITLATGGQVQYEIAPGQDAYDAGSAHGVVSTRYASWPGSFIFPAAPPGSGTFAVSPQSWQRNATEYRGKNRTRITVACSAGGTAGSGARHRHLHR